MIGFENGKKEKEKKNTEVRRKGEKEENKEQAGRRSPLTPAVISESWRLQFRV